MEIVPAALDDVNQAKGNRYTDEEKEHFYTMWKEAHNKNFSQMARIEDIDRGTLTRWAKEGNWAIRALRDMEVMEPSEERFVTMSELEMNGPTAAAVLVGMMNGSIAPDKIRLEAAKTLLSRIGHAEVRINEYVERQQKPKDVERTIPISEMTDQQKLQAQRELIARLDS